MTTRRQQRVSELLHQELSILITELTDSHLEDALVTVTRVDVSQDLRNASAYVEHALPASASRQVLDALYHSESFLRRGLIEHLNLRYVPHITFHLDDTTERGRRVDEILGMLETASEPQRDDERHDSD